MSKPEPARKLVLIVEDDEVQRDLYGDLLWYNGYDVIHCADGESAISTASEFHPDIVLLDIRLPGTLTGLDVARALREDAFEAPIIMVSVISREEASEAAIEAGASAFLEKPVAPLEVVKEVFRHVGHAAGGRGKA